jgi:dUTP pyrophosphatase
MGEEIIGGNLTPLYPDALTPSRSTNGAACVDLHAYFPHGGYGTSLLPHVVTPIQTGYSLSIPPNYVGLLFIRSGVSFHHSLSLINGVGVIDSDYHGEIIGGIYNHSDNPYTVNRGDRLLQLMVIQLPYTETVPLVIEEYDDEEYHIRKGGLGSTGL